MEANNGSHKFPKYIRMSKWWDKTVITSRVLEPCKILLDSRNWFSLVDSVLSMVSVWQSSSCQSNSKAQKRILALSIDHSAAILTFYFINSLHPTFSNCTVLAAFSALNGTWLHASQSSLRGWGFSSVEERLPGKYKALSSVPSTEKKGKIEKKNPKKKTKTKPQSSLRFPILSPEPWEVVREGDSVPIWTLFRRVWWFAQGWRVDRGVRRQQHNSWDES
jgi:hypothetical protein